MNRLILTVAICCIATFNSNAQTLKLDLFTKVPTSIKNCGAVYTFDTTALTKKKYILAVDLQNTGVATINGKVIQLSLGETKLENKTMNVLSYTGGGYTIILSYKTGKQIKKNDMESGTIEL